MVNDTPLFIHITYLIAAVYNHTHFGLTLDMMLNMLDNIPLHMIIHNTTVHSRMSRSEE